MDFYIDMKTTMKNQPNELTERLEDLIEKWRTSAYNAGSKKVQRRSLLRHQADILSELLDAYFVGADDVKYSEIWINMWENGETHRYTSQSFADMHAENHPEMGERIGNQAYRIMVHKKGDGFALKKELVS